jgi:hypothetical protein
MVHEIIQMHTQLHSAQFCDSIQTTVQNIDHLSHRVQLLEGLFNEYALVKSGAGRRMSDNTLPRLRDRHLIRKATPKSEKHRPQRRYVVFMKHGQLKRGGPQDWVLGGGLTTPHRKK